MGEDNRGNQTVWGDKKKNCIINIFCKGKKKDDMGDDKKQDGHCIINIFCCDDCMDGDEKKDGHCIINIFCDDKKHDDCDDSNNW